MFKYIDNKYYFTFRGNNPFTNQEEEIDTRFLQMALKEMPTETYSKMKSKEQEYDNIDGALYFTQSTFPASSMTFKFYIKKALEEETRQALKMLTYINNGRIVLGWDTNFYRLCQIEDDIEINEVDDDEYSCECEIVLSLAPYKYAIEGQDYVLDNKNRENLTHGSRIMNFYDSSFPMIYLKVPSKTVLNSKGLGEHFIVKISSLNSNGELIPGTTQMIKIWGLDVETTRTICIDSLNRFAYTTDANYGENANNLLDIESEFPILKPGMSMISFSQNYLDAEIAEVKIIPNWRSR